MKIDCINESIPPFIRYHYSEVHSPKHNVDGTINVIVKDKNTGKEMPFTAADFDTEEHGRWLYEICVAGQLGAIDPVSDDDIKMLEEFECRIKKKSFLDEAESIIRPLSDERDAEIISGDDLERWKAWVAYRKALRAIDVTSTDIEWPTKPE